VIETNDLSKKEGFNFRKGDVVLWFYDKPLG